MGSPALSKFQWGKETDRGTAVAADTMLAGAEIGPVNPDRVPTFPRDQLGVRTPSSRALIYQYLAENTLRIPEGYFQALPFFLSLGLKGGITPAEQTASQNDYLWDHTPSQTATNALDTATLELGDDTDAYEIEYLLFKQLRLAGQIAQGAEASPVEISGEYFGRQVTKAAFTGALSAPTMTEINAKLSRIYVDATWANRGNTEVTSLLRGWELEILTGVHPKFYGSANKYFDEHGEGDIEIMLALTYEGSSKGDTEFDTFRVPTAQAIQINLDSGVQLGTGDNHSLVISVWGAYETVIPMGEQVDGNNLHTAIFRGLYDPTGAQALEVKFTTDVAAL
jgi:hypothetical protein